LITCFGSGIKGLIIPLKSEIGRAEKVNKTVKVIYRGFINAGRNRTQVSAS
jgi:hypothetical protein